MRIREFEENPEDVVKVDVPLLIRLLEYAREDAKTDMDLHDLAEKLVQLSSEENRVLSMKDYANLVPKSGKEFKPEEPKPEQPGQVKTAQTEPKDFKGLPSVKGGKPAWVK